MKNKAVKPVKRGCHMYCPCCDNSIVDKQNNKYCGLCGQKLDWSDSDAGTIDSKKE